MNNQDIMDALKQAIAIEAESLNQLSESIDETFVEAVELLSECKGKVVITGVGKSGHIGKKIAATFASTGTPSFFMHSTEGVHGDLGMVSENDVVVLISNSGETDEVVNLIPTLRKIKVPTISISSNKTSTLGKNTDVALQYDYIEEADPLKLAPTTSSTMTLAIGDALAVALSQLKGFTKEDFHVYHPGGSLGKQLEELD